MYNYNYKCTFNLHNTMYVHFSHDQHYNVSELSS